MSCSHRPSLVLPGLGLALALSAACGDDVDEGETDEPTITTPASSSPTTTGEATGASTDMSTETGSGATADATTVDPSDATSDPTSDPTTDPTTGEPLVCDPWPDAIPQPWIGSDCAHDDDCGYEAGLCLLEEEGFPCGTCSQPCELYCPDLEGAPTTFCVDPVDLGLDPSGGLCVSQCDPGKLGGDGCREGYDCVVLPRYGDPGTQKGVCVPEGQGPPKGACHEELDALGVAYAPTEWPVEHPDGHPELDCVIEDPVWLYSPVAGVTFRYLDSPESPVLVSCEMAKAIHEMATMIDAMGGKEFRHVGTYNCRVISGTDTLSMHGLALAIDLWGFILDDDQLITVEQHWEKDVQNPVTPEGQWLRSLMNARYEQMVFHIILTPDYNDAHYNHFHVDLTPGGDFYK